MRFFIWISSFSFILTLYFNLWAALEKVEHLDLLLAHYTIYIYMVDIVDGNVADLATNADNWSTIRHIVV